jgi:hypothetical protein
MAVATADLVAWRDALISARLKGIRSVQDSDGSRIEYKSDAEMRAAIAAANDMIAAAGQSPPFNTIRFTTSKGL